VEVRIEHIERPGPDGYSMGRIVVLADDLYMPRRNFIFCHELAHILLGHTTKSTKSINDEHSADRMAVELMLPEQEFRFNMAMLDFVELRELYLYASWEVVARRWSELRPAVLTIYDNGILKVRTAPERLAYPHRPTATEMEIVRETIETRTNLFQTDPPLTMNTFFIDEGRGVERVILLTEVDDS